MMEPESQQYRPRIQPSADACVKCILREQPSVNKTKQRRAPSSHSGGHQDGGTWGKGEQMYSVQNGGNLFQNIFLGIQLFSYCS